MHKTWSTITSVLQTFQIGNTIKAILLHSVEITHEVDIAQLFNNFFTGIAAEVASNIPASNKDHLKLMSRVDAPLFIYQVTVNECTEVLS